jgi:integrase
MHLDYTSLTWHHSIDLILLYVSILKKMPKLTKSYIEKLPKTETGKQVILWDTEQRGLGIRCTAGAKSFVFQARLNGETIRTTIGLWPDWSLDMAREEARRLAVLIDRGVDPRQERKQSAEQGTTLEDAFKVFMGARELAPRTQIDYKRYFAKLADWHGKPLTKIDAGMVSARYRDIASSSSGKAQASSVMRFLRSLMNFAQATYGKTVLPENPVAVLTARREWLRDNVKTDHLRSHEIKPFLQAVRTLPNPTMAAYIEFLLLTGARRREGSQLKWKSVDIRARTLTFVNTKNHTDRQIPITPRVDQLLNELGKHRMGEFVFATVGKDGKPTHIDEPRKAMMRANTATGSQVTVHGLRRTYATMLESLDCPAWPLKALIGHSLRSDVTTGHYTQIGIERLRPWAEKYEKHIMQLVADNDGGKVVTLCNQKIEKEQAA